MQVKGEVGYKPSWNTGELCPTVSLGGTGEAVGDTRRKRQLRSTARVQLREGQHTRPGRITTINQRKSQSVAVFRALLLQLHLWARQSAERNPQSPSDTEGSVPASPGRAFPLCLPPCSANT